MRMDGRMSGIRGGARRGPAIVVLGLALLALLAGCSGGSGSPGGTNYNLGLAGSTLDHPANPPAIAAGGPGGAYAFVYDNQVWLKAAGQGAPKQLTHLALSNGATLRWGPLVWSHSGRYLAFSVVQDLNPGPSTPPRSSGSIYYVDAQGCAENCPILVTPGTGSVYGHTYTWIGDGMLLYASGSGLQLYTAGARDPRVWVVREVPTGPSGSSGAPDYYAFGDVAAAGGWVYYTRLDVRTPGHVGAVGTGIVARAYLGLTDTSPQPDPGALADRLVGVAGSFAATVAQLGTAYTDPAGAYVTGAWQLVSTRSGTTFVYERIDGVDAKAGTVTSHVCLSLYGSCDRTVLQKAGTHPWTARAELALSLDGKAPAYAADAFYLDGGDKLGPAGWTTPPAWSPDGQGVAVTQLVGQTTDADGVTRYQTNIVYYKGGQGTPLIAGAANLAFAPA